MNIEQPVVTAKFPDLAGKTAIVTGASRGIGAEIAAFLGKQGMKLMISARSQDKGQAVADSLSQMGVECSWLAADLATTDGARAVFDQAIEKYGRVDLLVNNAARLSSKPILELDQETYHDSFERNVRMIYEISFIVSHHMVDRKQGGNIIHISSVGGLRAHRGLAGYDASKGAIDALTRSMALDLGQYNIRVNAVAPGQTPHNGVRPLAGVPLGRTASQQEIAAAVAFLASDAGAYITGQIIYVDGGLTAQLTPPGIYI